MKNESNTAQGLSKMTKNTKDFTVLYKIRTRVSLGRNTDETVYTFTCGAVDADDAVRQLRMSRTYYVTAQDKRFKTTTFRRMRRVKGFKVVKVYSGEPVGTFVNFRGVTERKVMVIPAKQPRWMMRNYFGKGR
jgi:hypothetical protein